MRKLLKSTIGAMAVGLGMMMVVGCENPNNLPEVPTYTVTLETPFEEGKTFTGKAGDALPTPEIPAELEYGYWFYGLDSTFKISGNPKNDFIKVKDELRYEDSGVKRVLDGTEEFVWEGDKDSKNLKVFIEGDKYQVYLNDGGIYCSVTAVPSGITFAGWYDGDTPVEKVTPELKTLTAKWAVVIFLGNGMMNDKIGAANFNIIERDPFSFAAELPAISYTIQETNLKELNYSRESK